MADGAVYQAGWTLDDIPWSRFDASRVDPTLLAAVKAASLVEYNAPDYVRYLSRVYSSASPEIIRDIERWGGEEVQHGLALGRWAELADPTFNFQAAFARFLTLYRAPHFDHGNGSVRGSRRGEMISRCVVESGTASLYTALRDSSDEPVLKEIASRIAGDEFRHYRMFYDIGRQDAEPDLPDDPPDGEADGDAADHVDHEMPAGVEQRERPGHGRDDRRPVEDERGAVVHEALALDDRDDPPRHAEVPCDLGRGERVGR